MLAFVGGSAYTESARTRALGRGIVEADSRELVLERIGALQAQSVNGTRAAFINVLIFGVLFQPAVGWGAYGFWAVAMVVAYSLRDRLVRSVFELFEDHRRAELAISSSSALLCVVINLPALFFLPELSPLAAGLYVAMAVCWCLGAVFVIGIHTPSYAAYVGVGMSMIGLGAWISFPFREALVVSLGLVMMFFVVVNFSRRLSHLFNESYLVRNEQEKLVDRLEESIEQTRIAENARSTFLASTTHDILQPVHALMLLTNVLRDSDTVEQKDGTAEKIALTATSIESMFRGLLDMSRLDQGAIEPDLVDMRPYTVFEAIEAAYLDRCRGAGLRLEVVAPKNLMLLGDPVLLERALRNLVDNAVKYSSQGTVKLTAKAVGSDVEIVVSDEGRGIAAEDLLRVQEPFYRAEDERYGQVEGIGLGLSVSLQLIRLMGGEVSLESLPERGTTIRLVLPSAGAQPAASRLKTDSVPIGGSRARKGVLPNTAVIIDDDEIALQALQYWMSHRGIKVRAFESVELALLDYRESGFTPEHIVSDYQLGSGMNGIEGLKAYRKDVGEDLPATLVTGYWEELPTLPDNVRVIRKPLDTGRFEALLRQAGEQ